MNINDHQEMLFNAISDIDQNYVAEAQSAPLRSSGNVYKRIAVIAASLILVLSMVGLAWINAPDDEAESLSTLFVITVHAENGVETQMGLNQSYFNSGGTGETLFNVDMPLFQFSLSPSNWNSSGVISEYYDLEISYGGKVIRGGGDDHVLVGYEFPLYGSEGKSEYHIWGWFSEPTDLTMTIRDQESGEVVEILRVNITYCEDVGLYQLTFTEVYTRGQ